MNEISKKIGGFIINKRNNKEYSQVKLGEELEISGQQICKYESGRNDINFLKLLQICKILNVPKDEFLKICNECFDLMMI